MNQTKYFLATRARRNAAFGLILPFAALLVPIASSAQQDSTVEELSVRLVTVGPGKHVWERFGHNALWISDERSGFSRAYNYGLFSFEQEGFLVKFLQGRMEYWMRGFDSESHLQEYVSQNRTVWVQRLNLTPTQKAELRDFLAWNELPENRFYRYHYYHDNCSTRIRDAIDRVVAGAIRRQTEFKQTGRTLRFHSLRLVSDDLLTYTGLLLGLGQPVDEPISAWEEMFLPLKLREHLRDVVVVDEEGDERPLVLSERMLHESTEFTESAEPPRRTLWFLTVGIAVAFASIVIAHRATQRGPARAVLAGFSTLWYALIGLGGAGLAGLWMFTDHDTSYRNENLFLFNPVAIILIVLSPLMMLRKPWAQRIGRFVSILVAGVSFLGFLMQMVPGMDQVNGPLYALALPPNMALAAGLLWYTSLED